MHSLKIQRIGGDIVKILHYKNRLRAGALSALGFLLALAALLAYPRLVKAAMAGSISYCLTVLVPTLFPYMALACYAVNSPASAFLARPLGGIVRRLFRLPGCCGAAVLMSFVGGYPAGAKGAAMLLERGSITRRQAGHMLMFCVNPGPAFVVVFLGIGVLGSARLGWLLFLSVTLSGLLLGVVTALGTSRPSRDTAEVPADSAGALVRSVSDSAKSVLIMCACVVLFSGFTAIMQGCGLYGRLCILLARTRLFTPFESAALLSFLLEVTGGVGEAAKVSAGPAFYAFGLAFGGLCVHLQVFSLFDDFPVRRWKFFLGRFAHGLLAAGCYLGLSRMMPAGALPTGAALAAGGGGVFSGTFFGGASLLAMCAAFLLMTQEGSAEKKGTKGKSNR